MDAVTAGLRLRAVGLRVTTSRLAVLEAVERTPHVDAETLATVLRASHPSLTAPSVHKVLGDLTTAGLVRRIGLGRTAARFETRVGDNHHHAVCRSCGAIEDISCVVGHAPCLEPSDAAGFELEQAEVTFWGLCPRCRVTSAGERTS